MGLFTTQMTDPDLHKWRKTNLFYETDVFKKYQDPTVWGFKIMFVGINGQATGLLNDNYNVSGSAAHYLNSVKDLNRLKYLQGFTNMLQKINLNTPWYFQSIEGLDAAWKRDFNKPYSPGTIKIGCLESIDNKITTLIDLYRKSCFDWSMRREVVPTNLRQFQMWIFVYETRRFNWFVNDLIPAIPGKDGFLKTVGEIKNSPTLNAATISNAIFAGSIGTDIEMDKVNHTLFKFSDCEISLESGSEAFTKVSNAEGTPITQSITIKYESVEEDNLNTLYGPVGKDGGFGGNIAISDYLAASLITASLDWAPEGTVDIGDIAGETVKKLASGAAKSIAAKGISKIQSKLMQAMLGNIYGFSLSNTINQASSIINDPTSLITNRTEKVNNEQKTGPMGNVYK